MDDNVVAVKVTDDQEYVAREMQRYDLTAVSYTHLDVYKRQV